MKANELMIGDWVKVTHLNKIGKVYRIDVANGEGNGWVAVFDGDYHESLFEPVPLTPEILEKNGFVTNDEQGNWKGYRMYSLFDTNKICIFMLKLCEKDSIGEISLDMSPYYIVFKFVHQLQHALRLCGIDKTIEL